jgi:hypothetical protein
MIALLVIGFLGYKYTQGEKRNKENTTQETLIDTYARV